MTTVKGLMSRQSREYKVALEVELWKTLQLEQHEVHHFEIK